MVLPAAVTAATAVLPRTLTAHCMMTLPMAVMLHWRPMGAPMPSRRRQARELKARSSFSIRRTEKCFFR